MSESSKKSYGQILKSSVLIGASSGIDIILRIARTKALALILGPSGLGLIGVYGSITDLVQSVAGMGLNSSGVREIANAVASGNPSTIGRTVTVIRRVVPLFGVLGALFLSAFSAPISRISFGDETHSSAIRLLGLVVLFGGISAGQTALVQGMRRIRDLAYISIWGGFYGTLISIPIVYFFGEKGVAISLVAVAVAGIAISWWYSRKIEVVAVNVALKDILQESSMLFKLGSVFMLSTFMTMATAYLVRLIVLRQAGVEATGFYQAAWALGGLYVGFILNAMAADFYPSLTAVAKSNPDSNRLVNEQVEVGLLLATPGVLASLTLAQPIIEICYSSKFEPAIEILRWICLGMILRVSSWPMGFILRAKADASAVFWTELVKNLVYVGLAWICMLFFGLRGVGMAFFGSYLFYWLMIYALVRSVSEFRWSSANKYLGIMHATILLLLFTAWYFLAGIFFVIVGITLTIAASIYSLKRLCALDSLGWLPQPARRLLILIRLIPANE